MRSKVTAGLLALGLAACSGGTSGATKIDGSVKGKTFANPTAFFRVASGTTRDKVLVLISDDPDACSHLSAIPGDVKSTVLGSRSGVGCNADAAKRIPSLFLSLNEDVPAVGSDRTLGDSMEADFDPGTVTFPCATAGGSSGGTSGSSGSSGTSGSSGSSGTTGTEPTTGGSSGSSGTTATIGGTSPLVQPNSSGGHMFKSNAAGSASDVAEGDFDLAFPNGERLKGTFKAQSCNKLEGGCSSAAGLALLPSLAAALLLRRRRRS